MAAKYPLNKVFLLRNWDPVFGDIKRHPNKSGQPENIAQSRPQVIALFNQRLHQKDIGLLHHADLNAKTIFEKHLTGAWHRNGCSIYLWAHMFNGPNQPNKTLGCLPSRGFIS